MEVISEAGDGITAVERACESHPQVIVLELAMPEMNGLVAAKALRASLPTSAIVALTRHSDREFAEQSFAVGAHAYVLKQSSSTELLRAIRCAAAGEFYVDSALVLGDWNRIPQARHAAATNRQTAVLRLMAVGYTNKEIALELQISLKTVEVHKANAKRKLKLSSRADVVRYAAVNGWLRDP
jgi:DNA-binding NarL/FixJ family response regulator